MSCDLDSSELLLLVYEEVSLEDKLRWERHIAACPACLAELEELELGAEALDSLPWDSAPAPRLERIEDLLLGMCGPVGQEGPSMDSLLDGALPTLTRSWPSFGKRFPRWPLALAAMLLMAVLGALAPWPGGEIVVPGPAGISAELTAWDGSWSGDLEEVRSAVASLSSELSSHRESSGVPGAESPPASFDWACKEVDLALQRLRMDLQRPLTGKGAGA